MRHLAGLVCHTDHLLICRVGGPGETLAYLARKEASPMSQLRLMVHICQSSINLSYIGL